MRKTMLILFVLISYSALCQTENRFVYSAGITYNQQYPNGTYIQNYSIPNIEAGVGFRINSDHVFGMMPNVGFATHNFGLHRISDDYTKLYIRVSPYAGFNVLLDFDKNKSGNVFQSVSGGFRCAFYNRFNLNSFANVGLNFIVKGQDVYLTFAMPLFYSFPDQDLWAKPVDLDDYFYPLGNERWSITAGVVFKLGKKQDG